MKKHYIVHADLSIELIADETLTEFLSAIFGDNLLNSQPQTKTQIDILYLKNIGSEWQLIGSDLTLSVGADQLAKLLVKQIEQCFTQKYNKNAIIRAGAIFIKDGGIILPTINKKEIRSFCHHLNTLNTDDITNVTSVAVAFSGNGDRFDVLRSPDKNKTRLIPPNKTADKLTNHEGNVDILGQPSEVQDSRSIDDFQYVSSPKLFVFPNKVSDDDFHIEPLSNAQTLLELTGCVINGEQLPSTGFKYLSKLARDIPAIKVRYKNLEQIDSFFTELLVLMTEEGVLPKQLKNTFDQLSRGAILNGTENTFNSEKKVKPLADAIPKATPITDAHKNKKLTIAMATYDDYDGVYFSVQSLRMFHSEVCDDLEIIILDNNPTGKCAEPLKNLSNQISNLRYIPESGRSGTAVRDLVFKEANSEYVLCMDCHVMIEPGAVAELIDYYQADPDCRDLLQGPMLSDNLNGLSTHFKPKWNQGMYGTWGFDERAQNPEAQPFDIPMQGLGLFSCKKSAWPGFNSNFRGFGGEEGYIHEKIRQAGGRTLCLPFLRWLHRFARPLGVPYSVNWKDRVINYLIGFTELGLDVTEVKDHFIDLLSKKLVEECVEEVELLETGTKLK